MVFAVCILSQFHAHAQGDAALNANLAETTTQPASITTQQFPQGRSFQVTSPSVNNQYPKAEIDLFLCDNGSCTYYFEVIKYADHIEVTDIKPLKEQDGSYAKGVDYYIQHTPGGTDGGVITPGIYRYVDPIAAYNTYAHIAKISDDATHEALAKERNTWLGFYSRKFSG